MKRKDFAFFQNDKLISGEQLVKFGKYKDKINTECNSCIGEQQWDSIDDVNVINTYNILLVEEVVERIVNRKNKYIKRMERDIDKLSSCICYFNNEISDMHENNKECRLVNYYKERIEELERVIEYKRYKINQIRTEINRITIKMDNNK